jgi:hypothetical protein
MKPHDVAEATVSGALQPATPIPLRRSAPEHQPRPHSDHRATACFELHHRNLIVGPITIDEIRSGVAGGTIPKWAAVRRVTPWLGVEYVATITVPLGHEQHRCIQIRAGDGIIRGPVCLDQIRRAWAKGALPRGMEVRVVWRWESVGLLLERLAPVAGADAAS